MDYKDRIEQLINSIDNSLVEISKERKRGNAPTQVSSEFLTNKEQGDWAEKTLLNGINNNSEKYIAVKYGRDDDIIAGEQGFKEFYEQYQDELDSIGKRPDILIFRKCDFPYKSINISHLPINELDLIVPKAVCGIEVRSSAFLMEKYEDSMEKRNAKILCDIFTTKEKILNQYGKLLKNKNSKLYDIISSICDENLDVISFRTPSWKVTSELNELSNLLKKLNKNLRELSKRTYLSITPKIEDLKVVYNWIQRYNVPHYYVQVFFDRAYGISYENILNLLNNPDEEGKRYTIEKDVKNQYKTTIKIRANTEANILSKVDLPEHFSVMKELDRGRLLYFVRFRDSISTLNKEKFEELFGVSL